MISEFLHKSFNKNIDKPLFGARKSNDKPFNWTTYKDIYTKSQHLASFLSKNISIPPLDIFPFATVCICSENREEWMIADFACALSGLVSVGFHSSWPLNESIIIANDIHASAAIVSSKYLDYFHKIAEKQESLKLIICIDDTDDQNAFKLSDIYNTPLEPYETLPNDYHTIIYSSGTTGSPKGLPVTRELWLHDAQHGPFEQGERSVCLSFNSLAHGMDRGIVWQLLNVGGKIAFARTDFKGLLEDAREVEPSLLMSMPHLWNDLYMSYKDLIQKLIVEYLQKVEKITNPSSDLLSLLYRCCELKEKNPIVAGILEEAKETTSKMIGTKCKLIGTGGSSTSDQVLDFLKEIFTEAKIVNSYGTTEVPGISNNGQISPHVELKLVDCPECGYVSTETEKVGEIVVKIPNMACAYWGNRPESLKSSLENFRDGWYYTSDIGRIDENGLLHIIDRKSDLVELYDEGRSVWFPSGPLESLFMSNSKLFSRIYLHGDRMQSYMVAVVLPIKGKKVTHHQVLREIIQTARANNLDRSKTPRGVVISDHEWTQQTGELSTTNKIRRSVLLKKFKDQIDLEYSRITALEEKKKKIGDQKDFDYIYYKFLCDDDEDSKILNDLMGPIRDSILKLREMAVSSHEKMARYEEEVVKETDEVKSKCFKENEEAFAKIVDDVTFENFFKIIDYNKELVSEACRKRDNARFASDPDLQVFNDEVNKMILHLIEVADEIGEPLPYQISSGLLKVSPAKSNGNCLSEMMAPPTWAVWCHLCGELIEIGKYGEGTPRFKCLDCENVFCCHCFEMMTKLKRMCESHEKWKIPIECFTNDHYFSKEFKKFLRNEMKTASHWHSLDDLFKMICSLYENRVFIDKNENSPKLLTYKDVADQLLNSENIIIQIIKKDIDGNDQELIKKIFENKIYSWPIIIHVKKDEYDNVVIWNTMYNGGRLIIK